METTALTFAQPLWFLALLLIPAFAGLYYWAQRRSEALVAKVVAPRLRAQLAGAVSVGRRAFRAVLMLLALALLVTALARPQMGFVQKEVKQRGRDIIIAIDTSRSMLATDVTPTRLDRAKLIAQDLLKLVRGDRVGLVAFAGSAFLQAPLTLDQAAVLTSLDELDTSVIPKGGTNIAAAIRAAEEAFGKGEGQTRALVIFTDGEELDADGIAAAKRAADQGIRIFTIGIGSGEGSLIPLRDESGGTDFVRDSGGKPVQSRLDETRLQEIAAAGGGFYELFSADVASTIFQKGILPIEQGEVGVMSSRLPVEQYQWPLGASIALLMLWMLVGERRRANGGGRRAVVAAGLLLASTNLQAATGLDDYHAGDYDKASADFEKRLLQTPGSDRLQFNAGAASYQLGDFGKAVDHFTQALLSNDKTLREGASYNLGNALVRRGEAEQEKEKKKADWKNAIQHYTETLALNAANKQAEENREIVKKLLEDLEKEEQKQDQENQDDQKKDDQQDKQDQKDQQDQKNQDQPQNQKDQKDQKDQQSDSQQDQPSGGEPKDDQEKKNQDSKDEEQKDQEPKNQDQEKKDEGVDQKDEKPQDEKGDEQKDQKEGEKSEENNKEPEPKEGEPEEDGEGQESPRQPRPGQGEKKDQPAPAPTPGDKKEGELKSAGEQEEQPGGEEGEAAGEAEAAEEEGEMSATQARSLLNSLRSEEERVQLMQRREQEDTLKDW